MRAYTVRGEIYRPEVPDVGWSETGLASWYGYESPNATTATGEAFNTDLLSAAHKTLPLPSIVEVTNLDNSRKVRVRVNDRGPFVDGRIIDLSRGAAKALGVYGAGTARVRVIFLGPAETLITVAPHTQTTETRAPQGDRFVVQVGAFSKRENAEAAKDRLSNGRIRERSGLYVVYLGPFNEADAAEAYRQKAIDAGFGDAVLRRDN